MNLIETIDKEVSVLPKGSTLPVRYLNIKFSNKQKKCLIEKFNEIVSNMKH